MTAALSIVQAQTYQKFGVLLVELHHMSLDYAQYQATTVGALLNVHRNITRTQIDIMMTRIAALKDLTPQSMMRIMERTQDMRDSSKSS